MTLRAPLSVRINDGTVERVVNRYASGLKFRKTAPGGDHSIECNLDLPRDAFSDLGGGDVVKVDGPTGDTIVQGYLDNPGRVDGSSGQGFDATAVGTQVIAQDRRQPLYYRDTGLDRWEQVKANGAATGATAQSGDDPTATAGTDGTDGLICQFPGGQAIGSGGVARATYTALLDAGMDLGALYLRVKSGKTDSLYRNAIGWSSTPGAPSTIANFPTGTIQTTQVATTRFVNGAAAWTPGANRLFLELRRTGGATNVADDNTWSFFDQVAVMGRRYLSTGVLAASSSDMGSADYVTADAVVWDLLTRMLPQVDRNIAVVEVPGSPVQIDQLAFPDGATAGEVLDHLTEHETNFYWTLGPGSSAGLAFAWRAWPTTARYEISTADGFDQPGGDFELCNRVSVVWTDPKGRTRTTVVYAASDASATVNGFAIGAAATVFSPALSSLEQAGRLKDAETVELPDGRGSTANALRIGQAVLTAAANPPDSATATVRRPIVDLTRGGRALPWEVEPGCMVRIRETGQLIRLTETEYDDDDGSVTLTLGAPQPDTDQIINSLPQVRRRVA